jgi:UDP-glucose 4-epimerase
MILLTGASGFIGKKLLFKLSETFGKENVAALTSKPLEDFKYVLHHNYSFDADYLVSQGLGKVEILIHAGSYTPKSGADANDWGSCNSNIFTTDCLLKSTLPCLKKIIFLSTLDVYKECELISEASLLQPISLYGHSKLYLEKLIESFANKNQLVHQILRVGHVYGPGEEAYKKVIPVTIGTIISGNRPVIRGSGKDLRSFIYIDDVTTAIMNAVSLEKYAGVINLAGSDQISIMQLVEKIISISGLSISPEIIKSPSDIQRNLVFDNSKMKSLLLSDETPLDEGLLKEWEYMQKKYS